MATPVITEQDIRIFLMDKKELNPLLDGVRWDTKDIEQAVINAISYFNDSPPHTGNAYTVENFPYRYILLIGTAGHLLRSAAINEGSNQLDYSASGVQVQDKNKAELFVRMGGAYWDEFKEMTRMVKLNQAANSIYGTIGSEFGWRG